MSSTKSEPFDLTRWLGSARTEHTAQLRQQIFGERADTPNAFAALEQAVNAAMAANDGDAYATREALFKAIAAGFPETPTGYGGSRRSASPTRHRSRSRSGCASRSTRRARSRTCTRPPTASLARCTAT